MLRFSQRRAQAEHKRLLARYRARVCEPDLTLGFAFDHAVSQWPALLDFMRRLDDTLETEHGKMVFSSVMRNAIVRYTAHLMDGPTAHWPYERLQVFFNSVEADLKQWAPLLCNASEQGNSTRGTDIEQALIPASIANILERFKHEQVVATDVLRVDC